MSLLRPEKKKKEGKGKEARPEKLEEAPGKRQRKTMLRLHKEELTWSRERSEKERKDEEEMEGDLRPTMDPLKS